MSVARQHRMAACRVAVVTGGKEDCKERAGDDTVEDERGVMWGFSFGKTLR